MQSEFPLDESIIYLNHAGVSPWPRRSRDAVVAFADENIHRGAADYPRWIRTETRLRERLASLINAPHASDIALIKNTSEGLSFIAQGLQWSPGDAVIINQDEFPSNRIVWEALASSGVEIVDVDLRSAATPEDALIAAMNTRPPRLLSVSSVQYGSGLRMDLPRLAAACRERGVLFCVDAIQTLGALRFDLDEVDADFVVADGHKWMLGPEGLGLFYCRPALRDSLRLVEHGWHMVAAAGDYDRRDWQPAPDARRFECGSPNMLCAHGLEASLSLLLDDVGLDEVEARVLGNSAWLMDRISAEPQLDLVSDPTPERRSGIVTFRAKGVEGEPLYRGLREAGVVCAKRGGGIRFSPHFYVTQSKLERAMDQVMTLAHKLRDT